MLQLASDLQKERNVSESTANQYIQTLFSLHNKTPFNNLGWLKKTEEVEKRLSEFAPATQKGYVSAVVSVLSPYKDKATYKKVYKHYYDLMMNHSKEARENKVEGKTQKQQDNWADWTEVQKKRSELSEECGKFMNKKHISPSEYDSLLKSVVLALYTDIQPRRNQDYMDMYVVKKWSEDMPKDKNYLDLGGSKVPKQFIFNKYKTAKKYGEQKVEIPEALASVLSCFLKHHPLNNAKTKEFKLLVSHDGSPLTTVNVITRILNKIFGKKIGSSMLRHIYITGKYGELKTEMAKDAEAMGHSVSEQQNVYNVPK
jgi:hypothetical protein